MAPIGASNIQMGQTWALSLCLYHVIANVWEEPFFRPLAVSRLCWDTQRRMRLNRGGWPKIKMGLKDIGLYWSLTPHTLLAILRTQRVTKRCRLSLLTNSALVIRVQMRGEGVSCGLAGSQPMSAAVHITWHGAQINFGDLPQYLTYGIEPILCRFWVASLLEDHNTVVFIPLINLIRVA